MSATRDLWYSYAPYPNFALSGQITCLLIRTFHALTTRLEKTLDKLCLIW
jgi:hypothetical protein